MKKLIVVLSVMASLSGVGYTANAAKRTSYDPVKAERIWFQHQTPQFQAGADAASRVRRPYQMFYYVHHRSCFVKQYQLGYLNGLKNNVYLSRKTHLNLWASLK